MNGNQLKWAAIIAMAIDHIGIVLLGFTHPLYGLCRLIGRLAFPIFCFFIAEGYVHTGNRMRYFMRLALFALLSEIPFDLAFHGRILEFGGQNVFFTLALGLLGLILFERLSLYIRWGALIAPVLCMLAAEWLQTDYGGWGVVMIAICYFLRESRWLRLGGLGLSNVLMAWESGNVRQLFGCAALIPIFLYNGQRGKSGKWNRWFFYLFYPIHLLLLWGVQFVSRG